jgi:hypothetical protein
VFLLLNYILYVIVSLNKSLLYVEFCYIFLLIDMIVYLHASARKVLTIQMLTSCRKADVLKIKQDSVCTCNVTSRRVRVSFVALEKQ